MTLLPDVERALTDAVDRQIATTSPTAGRRRWRRSTVLAAVVGATVSVTAVAAAAGLISDRAAAPEAQRRLPVLGSAQTSALADYRGKTLLVTFYASWCDPCRRQAQIADRLGREMRAAGTGAAVLIGYRDDAASARAFVEAEHLELPVLGDPDNAIAAAYGIAGIPEIYILDPEGRIAFLHRGRTDEATLRTEIAAAAQPPAATAPPGPLAPPGPPSSGTSSAASPSDLTVGPPLSHAVPGPANTPQASTGARSASAHFVARPVAAPSDTDLKHFAVLRRASSVDMSPGLRSRLGAESFWTRKFAPNADLARLLSSPGLRPQVWLVPADGALCLYVIFSSDDGGSTCQTDPDALAGHLNLIRRSGAEQSVVGVAPDGVTRAVVRDENDLETAVPIHDNVFVVPDAARVSAVTFDNG